MRSIGSTVTERAARVARALTGARDGAVDRWHFVTVNRAPQDVMPDGQWPAPLAELGEAIDIRVRPAPGDRGTELGARLRGDAIFPAATSPFARVAGKDPRQRLRAALRESKQLLETGEILQPDDLGTARRTPMNLPLELATRVARGEGLL